jgi:hypothetical protein
MDKPLHERKVLLERIVQPIPTRVEVEHGERIDVGTEDGQRRLEARFIEAFELGLEGLMIKNPYFQYAVVSTALEAGILTTRTLMVRLGEQLGSTFSIALSHIY